MMKKRMVSLLLCLVLVLALMPTSVFAVREYDVWVDGVQITSANYLDVLGDGKVAFNPDTMLLLFQKGAALTNRCHIESGAFIYADLSSSAEPLRIVAPVTNGLTIGDGTKGSGIFVEGGDLVISGDVTIDVAHFGIYAIGSVLLSGDQTKTIRTRSNNGIQAHGRLSIMGDGDVRIETVGSGIYVGSGVGIFGNGDVYIETEGAGIDSSGLVSVTGDGDLTINAGGKGIDIRSGDLTLSGSGELYVKASEAGISVYNFNDDEHIICDRNATVISTNSDGIKASASLTLSGSGNMDITSNVKNGIYAPKKTTISNDGNLTIKGGFGVYIWDGGLTLSGDGDVDIYGTTTGIAVGGFHDDDKVLLEGTSNRIKIESQNGAAVLNGDTNDHPVAGSNFSNYKVTGSPASASVTYTLKKPAVSDVTITDLERPAVGNHPDTTITITNSQGFKLTGTAKWLEYDSTTPKVMSASDVFKEGVKYTCLITVNTTESHPFAYSVELGSHHEVYLAYAGTFTVNGEALDGKKGTLGDNVISLSMRWWDKAPMAADCGGDPGVCALTPFTDVPKYTNWAHKGIEYCVVHSLMNGTTATTFEPKTAMSRAMLVTVLYRMEGQPGAGSTTFTDVPGGKWFSAAVSWAADHGIVTGKGDGTFDPNGNVTREQIATILYRYSSYKGYDTSNKDNLAGFADASKVGKWFVEGMQWAVAEGLINGTLIQDQTRLTPQGDATREQVAAILMRFCENVAK